MTPDEKNVMQTAQRYLNWTSQKIFLKVANKKQRRWTVKRGEVLFVDLGQNIGSEENKIRPVVVLQANAYNFHSPVFTCAIISRSPVTIHDIQVPISGTYTYTDHKGCSQHLCGAIDLGQIKTIAKERIVSKKVCDLGVEMASVDEKLMNVFGLKPLLVKRDHEIASLQGKVEYLKNQIKELDTAEK